MLNAYFQFILNGFDLPHIENLVSFQNYLLKKNFIAKTFCD